MPKISIIVPIYKVEKYIKKCIDSILNQTFKDFELILVNDGSPDRCEEICNQYAAIDKRIKIINKENGGLSSARNAGIEVATGEYIAFVDSDDYINESMYEILYSEALKNESDIVICGFENVYESEDCIVDELSNYSIVNYNNIEALKELYNKNHVNFIIACNKLYKRHLFDSIRYEIGRIHEDEFIVHKILIISKNITFVDLKLYYYLQRENSIMQTQFNIKSLDFIYALEERMKFFKRLNDKQLILNSQYWYVTYLLDYYYKAQCNIKNCDKELKKLKINFIKNLLSIINNTKFTVKEKLAWIVFILNSKYFKERYKI